MSATSRTGRRDSWMMPRLPLRAPALPPPSTYSSGEFGDKVRRGQGVDARLFLPRSWGRLLSFAFASLKVSRLARIRALRGRSRRPFRCTVLRTMRLPNGPTAHNTTHAPLQSTHPPTQPTPPHPAQPNPAKPNPTQSNPTQPNPTQPNPTQPNPTHPNPTQPSPLLLTCCCPSAFFIALVHTIGVGVQRWGVRGMVDRNGGDDEGARGEAGAVSSSHREC